MASIKLINNQDYSVSIENIEAEIDDRSEQFIYELKLSRNDILNIFESSFNCKLVDGREVNAEILGDPIMVGTDAYQLRLAVI